MSETGLEEGVDGPSGVVTSHVERLMAIQTVLPYRDGIDTGSGEEPDHPIDGDSLSRVECCNSLFHLRDPIAFGVGPGSG